MRPRISSYAEFVARFKAIDLVVKSGITGIIIVETADKISIAFAVCHERIKLKKVQKITLDCLSFRRRQDVLELEAGEM